MDIRYITGDQEKEFFTEERCFILELYNFNDDRSQSLARARVEPGITTAWHLLRNTSEIFYILSGEGIIEIGEDFRKSIFPGTVIHVPPSVPQRLTNTGKEDLLVLCFCVPAYSDACYEALE